MTQSTPHNYDFQMPGGLAVEHAQQLKLWMSNFTNLFKEKWQAIVPSVLTMKFESDAAFSFGVLKDRMPKPAIGIKVRVGHPGFESLVVVDRKAALAIVMEMTGEQPEENEDRNLSTIEQSLLEMFVKEVVGTQSESWIEQDSLAMECLESDFMPHRSRMFSPKRLMLCLNFKIEQGENSFDLFWNVPQSDFSDLLSESQQPAPEQKQETRIALESLTNDMKVKLSVLLGEAELTFSQMEKLSVGDVIVFDQKISDPLCVAIEEQQKFTAWAGRHGNNQAIKISEMVS